MRKYLPLLGLLWLMACQETDIGGAEKELLLHDLLEETLVQVSPTHSLDFFQFPDGRDLASIPQDPRNPITQEKVILGRALFHETALGTEPLKPQGEYTYSCASCHHVSAGFQAGRRQGIGEGGAGFGVRGEGREISNGYLGTELDVQPTRSPATLNVAYQKLMLWNGQFGATGLNGGTRDRWTPGTPLEVNELGYEGVESQAIAGLTVHRMAVDKQWAVSMDYQAMFDAAFPDWPEERRYSLEAAGLAIAAYERTLLAQEAPFQRWLRGKQNAMTEDQVRGAILFFGKAGCASCHTGPALNSEAFYALGMNDLEGPGVFSHGLDAKTRLGRAGFTGRAADSYRFKVPQLYNLKDSPFYGHGGSFQSVREVIEYKNEAQAENPNVPESALDRKFAPLGLSPDEVEAITIFLEDGLYDPDLLRHVPAALRSGFCFPNNDFRSRQDLGCQ